MPPFQKLSPLLSAQHTEKFFDTETVIIPGKINIVPTQVLPIGKIKMSEVPSFWGILRRDWGKRTIYIYEIVTGRP